jgi:hypothetical protein
VKKNAQLKSMNSLMNLECYAALPGYLQTYIRPLGKKYCILLNFEKVENEIGRITANPETVRLPNHTVSYQQHPMKIIPVSIWRRTNVVVR